MAPNGYDVVVIGSGIGGMAAASLLAKKGVRTLLVESKERLGGRFSTINYEGFKLPTGAQLLHEQGWIPWLLKEMGLKVELRPVPRLFYRIRDQEYEMPEKGRLRMLLNFLDKAEADRGKIAGNIVKEVAASMLLNGIAQTMAKPETERSWTLRDWLLQYTDNEIVHEIMDQLCSSAIMGHSWEIPASEFFFFMARSGGQRDLLIAPYGSISIVEALAGAIKPVCDIWTNCAVRQIMIKQGKATGMIVEKDGKTLEIPCRAVISNIGPTATIQIAGKENFTADYLKQLRMKLRPSPCVLILIASDRPLCLDGKTALMITIGTRRIGAVVPLTNTCPELAPPGQHLLYSVGEPKSCLLPMDEEYEKQQCMLDIKEQFPDFEKYGRILKMEPRNIDHEWPEERTWNG
ncbi:MAG: FAD-dependent oxidoreductase [Chloroflexi bacterium]|nr:FAD-dependent oxidoreductase [Chloroflexota bacterium]